MPAQIVGNVCSEGFAAGPNTSADLLLGMPGVLYTVTYVIFSWANVVADSDWVPGRLTVSYNVTPTGANGQTTIHSVALAAPPASAGFRSFGTPPPFDMRPDGGITSPAAGAKVYATCEAPQIGQANVTGGTIRVRILFATLAVVTNQAGG